MDNLQIIALIAIGFACGLGVGYVVGARLTLRIMKDTVGHIYDKITGDSL